MVKAVAEIEDDIRALTEEDKRRLLRDLIAELDAPATSRTVSNPRDGFGMIKLKSRGKPRRLSDFDAANLMQRSGT